MSDSFYGESGENVRRLRRDLETVEGNAAPGPEGRWILAGGVSPRIFECNTKSPGGAPEASDLPSLRDGLFCSLAGGYAPG
jgi:hypothetical protein